MPRPPDTRRRDAMGKGGFAALEAVGMVITALAVQTVIRGPLDQDSERLWGIFNWVPGGLGGQVILLGFIALVAMMSGAGYTSAGKPDSERASDSGGFRSQETA
ncbi:hypothetical protein [Streptomyces scopuliridis]|uniref:hypothetical protein n=1 Tax=Streptomyces scopuliridis TaxID=452529 RepID=UPI0036A896AB